MKLTMVLIGQLLLAAVAHAQGGFVQTLPASDFTSAGLQKQTPAELARLEFLIQRYMSSGARPNRAPAVAPQPEQPAGLREPASAASPAKKQPGWFAAVLTLNRVAEKPEQEEPLASRLVGDFAGWNGRTVFQLENGTTWVQKNRDEIFNYSPVLNAPNVVIRPAALGGFWLEIAGVNKRLRILPQLAQK